mmetsp:Transcript_58756/g.108434  ORF Transcript_58756/g.108434 Transcript_58756/m.108434 type:complete len:187 (-) Transcript_58756:68-628(-)
MHVIDPAVPGSPGDAGAAYSAYGFRKSFRGVWSPESLRFYSDQKLSGRELHPALGQDVHRMGGDLLLDASGRAILCHYSKTNTDRPDVQATLLPLIRAAAGSRKSTRSAAEALLVFACGFFVSTCLHPPGDRRKVLLPVAALLLGTAACRSVCQWPIWPQTKQGHGWDLYHDNEAAQAGERPECKS